jgi:hypothetical protein
MRHRRSYALSTRRKNPIGSDVTTIGLGVAGGILLASGISWLAAKITAPSS